MSFEYDIALVEVTAAVPSIEAIEDRRAQDVLPMREARQRVLVKMFKRGISNYHGVPVKFE